MTDLQHISMKMKQFAIERDWEKFHTPKNLAMALAAESGELLECFQWLDQEQCLQLSAEQKRAVADEIADVQLYLVRLADVLSMDIATECERKMQLNAIKYPVALAKGSAQKYTAYE